MLYSTSNIIVKRKMNFVEKFCSAFGLVQQYASTGSLRSSQTRDPYPNEQCMVSYARKPFVNSNLDSHSTPSTGFIRHPGHCDLLNRF
jgi:hypothetical protein